MCYTVLKYTFLSSSKVTGTALSSFANVNTLSLKSDTCIERADRAVSPSFVHFLPLWPDKRASTDLPIAPARAPPAARAPPTAAVTNHGLPLGLQHIRASVPLCVSRAHGVKRVFHGAKIDRMSVSADGQRADALLETRHHRARFLGFARLPSDPRLLWCTGAKLPVYPLRCHRARRCRLAHVTSVFVQTQWKATVRARTGCNGKRQLCEDTTTYSAIKHTPGEWGGHSGSFCVKFWRIT